MPMEARAAGHRRTRAGSTWLAPPNPTPHELPARHRRRSDGSAALIARAIGATGVWLLAYSLMAMVEDWPAAGSAVLVAGALIALGVAASRLSPEVPTTSQTSPLWATPQGVNHHRNGYGSST
jgi:hypothetical protein